MYSLTHITKDETMKLALRLIIAMWRQKAPEMALSEEEITRRTERVCDALAEVIVEDILKAGVADGRLKTDGERFWVAA